MTNFRKAALGLMTCLLSIAAVAHGEDAKPAPAKDEQTATVGEPHTQTLKSFTYFYLTAHLKFAELGEKLMVMIPALEKGLADNHVSPGGPLVFIYHGATEDPSAEFDLEVGFPVKEKVPANGDFKLREVPEFHCMSALFTGPLDQIAKVYEKLMPAVAAGDAKKTGETREMYLYWESPQSANNVVMVSAGVK